MSILVLQMFPAFLSMTAIYILLSKANLIDTYTGLLLVYVTGSLPFMTWLVKGYFDAIPTSLDEAAKIDGAGHLTIFIQIILPLAKPILVFVGLVSFTGPWMDFILPTLVLRSEDKMTTAIGILVGLLLIQQRIIRFCCWGAFSCSTYHIVICIHTEAYNYWTC